MQTAATVIDTRQIRVALLEENPSIRSKLILPELAERFAITYVTGGCDIPPARYERVIKVRPAAVVLQRSWEISVIADDLYRRNEIDFAVSWERIGLFTSQVPVLLAIGGSYLHEITVIVREYPWWKRWRALSGFIHYAIPEIVAIRRARLITVPSVTMRTRIHRMCGVPFDRIRVVPEGIGDLFVNSYHEDKYYRSPRIAFVGRIHPGKGILAFAREFTKSRIDAPFVIAGDGPEFAALKQLASRDSRLRLMGWLPPDEVANLLRETSIFVWPSLYEGCPIALLEAMASGHAIVAYPEGSSAEILDDSALYAAYGSASALCGALETLIRDSERVRLLARKAHDRSRQFCWQHCLSRTQALYVEFYRKLRGLPPEPVEGPPTSPVERVPDVNGGHGAQELASTCNADITGDL